MPHGIFSDQRIEEIARATLTMGNKAANRFIISAVFANGSAADRAQWHRRKVWARRVELIHSDPELAARVKALNKAARAALRAAADELLDRSLD